MNVIGKLRSNIIAVCNCFAIDWFVCVADYVEDSGLPFQRKVNSCSLVLLG